MSYLILVRVPSGNLVGIVNEDGESLAEYQTEQAARAAADDTMLCVAYGYEIIEFEG